MAEGTEGRDGELLLRLLAAADDPAPQVRAVVTTLLIKGLDGVDQQKMIGLMVRSDGAARLVDPIAADEARHALETMLFDALSALAVDHGERRLVAAWRDHLRQQMERWAARAVDDADNRRRAERFLLFADNPSALAAAKRRGFLLGMSAADLRRLAASRSDAPVSPETATELWAARDAWLGRLQSLVGEHELESWESVRSLHN